MSSVLSEIGPEALTHRDELEEVKRQLNIRHDYFDCWIYGFLENKKFSIEETVSKLQRRAVMESTELAQYVVTDYMKETMRKGIIQLIGTTRRSSDIYINTKRDYPTAKRREENKRNFDMWLTYGTRLRKENKRCRIAMLINQKDASLWSNTDMTFQADVALRIAKFYPGVVDRMYITKMSNTLSAMAKPIFTRLPAIVSERIRIFSEDDVKHGKLLELFDEDVLPVDLGGKNACDGPQNGKLLGTRLRAFEQLKMAVSDLLSVKEWERKFTKRVVRECGVVGAETTKYWAKSYDGCINGRCRGAARWEPLCSQSQYCLTTSSAAAKQRIRRTNFTGECRRCQWSGLRCRGPQPLGRGDVHVHGRRRWYW